jgi:hypothetical protein
VWRLSIRRALKGVDRHDDANSVSIHPGINAPPGRLCARNKQYFRIFSHCGDDYASGPLGGLAPTEPIPFEVTMLDLFYVAIAIAFFILLWGFTRASERL